MLKSARRVIIVDFTDPEYAQYRTGDCHGIISSELIKSIGGEKNRACQFRFSWLRNWDTASTDSTPQVSFLAKGTLRPDDDLLAALADSEGNKPQLILDRSSIKAINPNFTTLKGQAKIVNFTILACLKKR